MPAQFQEIWQIIHVAPLIIQHNTQLCSGLLNFQEATNFLVPSTVAVYNNNQMKSRHPLTKSSSGNETWNDRTPSCSQNRTRLVIFCTAFRQLSFGFNKLLDILWVIL